MCCLCCLFHYGLSEAHAAARPVHHAELRLGGLAEAHDEGAGDLNGLHLQQTPALPRGGQRTVLRGGHVHELQLAAAARAIPEDVEELTEAEAAGEAVSPRAADVQVKLLERKSKKS